MESEGMSPVTQPMGPLDEVQPQRAWPKVIGIISIVFGCFGMLCNCMNFFQQKLMEFFASSMSEAASQGQNQQTADMVKQFEIQMEVMRAYATWSMLAAFLGLCVAAWLLINGVGLTMRKPWARGSSLAWAMAKSIFVVGASVLGFAISTATLQGLEDAGLGSGMQSGMGQMFGMIGIVIGLVWGLALPVFLMIYLGRAKIRDEVAGWSEAERRVI